MKKTSLREKLNVQPEDGQTHRLRYTRWKKNQENSFTAAKQYHQSTLIISGFDAFSTGTPLFSEKLLGVSNREIFGALVQRLRRSPAIPKISQQKIATATSVTRLQVPVHRFHSEGCHGG